MRASVILALGLILMLPAASTQIRDNVTVDDVPEPQDSATCGDGVCESIERGVCPSDCSEGEGASDRTSRDPQQEGGAAGDTGAGEADDSGGNTPSEEDNDNPETAQEESDSDLNLPDVSLIILAATGILVLLTASVVLIRFFGSRSAEADEEVERWIRGQLRQGKSIQEIEDELENRGVDSAVIEASRKNVDLEKQRKYAG